MRAVTPAILFLACSPQSEVVAPQAPPEPESTASAWTPRTSSATAEPEPSAVDLISTACAGRDPCRGIETLSAGRDAEGAELGVVKLALFDQPGVGDDVERRQRGECDLYEYWLVRVLGHAARDPELLLVLCNDGYGASGVGEDVVEVSANTFSHSRYGGSAWRWHETLSLSLSPLRPRAVESESYWNLGTNFTASRFDWDELRGRYAWYTPRCDAEGAPLAPPGDAEGEIGGSVDAPPGYAYVHERIPSVTLPAGFLEHPGASALGACAATIDASGERGFLLSGTPSTATDAALSVVATLDGTRLFVELSDDSSTSGDRLELWIRDSAVADRGSHCMEPPRDRPSAWSIHPGGKVERLQGKARSPIITVHGTPDGKLRYEIARKDPTGTLTLVQQDSDDGSTVERRIATSKLRPDDPDSLGALHAIGPSDAVCELESGRLVPRLKLGYTAER